MPGHSRVREASRLTRVVQFFSRNCLFAEFACGSNATAKAVGFDDIETGNGWGELK